MEGHGSTSEARDDSGITCDLIVAPKAGCTVCRSNLEGGVGKRLGGRGGGEGRGQRGRHMESMRITICTLPVQAWSGKWRGRATQRRKTTRSMRTRRTLCRPATPASLGRCPGGSDVQACSTSRESGMGWLCQNSHAVQRRGARTLVWVSRTSDSNSDAATLQAHWRRRGHAELLRLPNPRNQASKC